MKKFKHIIIFIFIISTVASASLLKLIELEKYVEKTVHSQIEHLVDSEDFFVQVQLKEKVVVENNNKSNFNSDFKVSPLSKFDLLDIKVEETDNSPKTLKIDDVKVTIHFDKNVTEITRKKVGTLIKENFSNFAGNTIKYSFKDYEKEVISPMDKELEKKADLLEKLPLLELTIAGISLIFFAILLLGISKFFKFGTMLVKSLESLKPEGNETNVEVNGSMTAEASSSDSDSSNPLSSDVRGAEEANKGDGLKNFIEFLDENPSEGANQVRRWKREETSLGKNAITYTVRSLGLNTLKTFLLEFTPDEKTDLMTNLAAPMENDLKTIDTFILDSLLEIMIKPNVIADVSFHKTALTTETSQLVEIAENNPTLGSELLAILPPTLVDQVCEKINPDTFSKVMSESLSFSKDKLKDDYKNIHEALKSSRKEELKEMSPVFDQMIHFFENATQEKESIIIDILAKAKPKEEFRDIMFKNFPRELMPKLPKFCVKQTLMKLNMKDVIPFLAIQEEEERNRLFNILAEEGSQLRDIFELELSNLLDNPTQLDKIKAKEHEVTSLFLVELRQMVQSPKFMGMIDPVLNPWVDKKYDQAENLKLAA